MPKFESRITLPRSLPELFDFFCHPANLEQVTPPELQLRIVEGPSRLELGARFVVQGRRWGMMQKVVSVVTAFESNAAFVDEMQQGPFRRFIHAHHFEADSQGTRVIDVINYEPPGGLLGLMVNNGFIERDLKWVFDYRVRKLNELFGG